MTLIVLASANYFSRYGQAVSTFLDHFLEYSHVEVLLMYKVDEFISDCRTSSIYAFVPLHGNDDDQQALDPIFPYFVSAAIVTSFPSSYLIA